MQDVIQNFGGEVTGVWNKFRALPGNLRASVILFLVMCCVVLTSYAFVLTQIVASWKRPEYEAGILIPIMALVVLWCYRRPITASSTAEQLLGVGAILFFSGIRYYFWVFRHVQQPMYYSLIGCIGGLILILGGWRMVKWTWPGLLLLTLAMPFSAKMERLTFTKLQEYSTKSSVYALETLGVDVENKGNEIKLRQGTEEINLNVAEASPGSKACFRPSRLR
ncbi:MAG: archaeosortase/exosortase family protein [Pirellulales bacterium]